jgi:hypothetical protein
MYRTYTLMMEAVWNTTASVPAIRSELLDWAQS